MYVEARTLEVTSEWKQMLGDLESSNSGSLECAVGSCLQTAKSNEP